MTVEMQYVQSSTIEQIGYDEASQELYVKFLKNGGTYVYLAVSESVYQELLSADSLGKYFNQNIKPVYAFRRE